jgi:hypothetical protein
MKILLFLSLIIVAVCGKRVKRQSWMDGLWGRELLEENARRKDMAAVSSLFNDAQSDSQYKNDVTASETRQNDRLNLRNEVQDSRVSFPQVTGQEGSKLELLRYLKRKQESQQE